MKVTNKHKTWIKIICMLCSITGLYNIYFILQCEKYNSSVLFLFALFLLLMYPSYLDTKNKINHDNEIIANNLPVKVIERNTICYNDELLLYYNRILSTEGTEYADEGNGTLYLRKEHFNCRDD